VVNRYLIDTLAIYKQYMPPPAKPTEEYARGGPYQDYSYEDYNRIVLGDTNQYST
jgi:hypothetical protein